jgi:hypothetical protein
MNTEFVTIVKRIIAEQGESILADPARLKGLVHDFARDVPKAERLAFGRCVEYGAYVALKQRASSSERYGVKQVIAQKIHKEEGMDRALCITALDILEALIADTGERSRVPHNTPPVQKTAPVRSKKLVVKIAGCIGLVCLILVLGVVKEIMPTITMNKALEETARKRKNSLPLPPPVLEAGWERISLPGIGTLDIPPDMEMREGQDAGLDRAQYDDRGILPDTMVFQQKGLNENTPESFQTYARVLIKTTAGNPGDYASLYFPVPHYQNDESKEIDAYFKAAVTHEYAQVGIQVLTWNTASLETVNGMSCIHYSFTRQLQDNPIVVVHSYIFQNIDTMYALTLSYRLEQEAGWKDDYEKILNSFRITTINSGSEE